MEQNNPEYKVFTPTERYVDNTNFVIDELFFFMPDSDDQPEALKDFVEHRAWVAGDTSFYILRNRDQEAATTEDHDGSLVRMLTFYKREDDVIRSRTYSYSRNTGMLQVFTDARSHEEVMKMRVDSIEAQKYSEGIAYGMEQHIFTASELEYDRFLHDLESFRHSTSIS